MTTQMLPECTIPFTDEDKVEYKTVEFNRSEFFRCIGADCWGLIKYNSNNEPHVYFNTYELITKFK